MRSHNTKAHAGHNHPTELHAAICAEVGDEKHRQACHRYEVSNTTLSGWINDGNPIGMDADRQKVLERVLGVDPYEVVRMWGGLNLEGGATVGGPSPRSANRQSHATSNVADIRTARTRTAEVVPLPGIAA